MAPGDTKTPDMNPQPAPNLSAPDVKSGYADAGNAAEKAQSQVNGFNGAVSETKPPHDIANVFKDGLQVLEKLGGGAKDSLKEIGAFAGGLISSITNNAQSLAGTALVTVNDTFRKMANPLEGMGALSESTALTGLNQAMKAILETQQTARVGFIRLGQSIEVSEQAAANYPNTLRRISAAYGMQGKELDGMMKSLQGVPIIMNQTAQMASNSVDAQQLMVDATAELAMVSSTFGMSASEASTVAAMSYRQFNQTVEETIDTMSTMSAAAKESGVDRKIANEQIMEASRGLAIFGQKSDSAAGTWLTFMKALKDTTPIDQVGSITEQVTKSIATMSVQNRAFIGMMSGMAQGRSALGGSIQMEMMLRSPDGMQKHLESLTSTLAQFAGGQIITLEEAAKNPQLEVSFQMQREMIGKLTGITDAQVQNRILETLKNVQSGGMSQADGTKELANLQKEGGSIQDKQLTALEKIDQHLAVLLHDAFGIDTTIDRLNSFAQGETGKEDEGWIKKGFQEWMSPGKEARSVAGQEGASLRRQVRDKDHSGTTISLGATQNILSQQNKLGSAFARVGAQTARPQALQQHMEQIRWGTKEFNFAQVSLTDALGGLTKAFKYASSAIGGKIGNVEEQKLVESPTIVKEPTVVTLPDKAIDVMIKNTDELKGVVGGNTQQSAITIAGDAAKIKEQGYVPGSVSGAPPSIGGIVQAVQKEESTVAAGIIAAQESKVGNAVSNVAIASAPVGSGVGVRENSGVYKNPGAPTIPLLEDGLGRRERAKLASTSIATEVKSDKATLAVPTSGTNEAIRKESGLTSGLKNDFTVNINLNRDSDDNSVIKIVQEEVKIAEERINKRINGNFRNG